MIYVGCDIEIGKWFILSHVESVLEHKDHADSEKPGKEVCAIFDGVHYTHNRHQSLKKATKNHLQVCALLA